MNRELLDPFEPEYPENIEVTVEDKMASVCEFNRMGSLFAVGKTNGELSIWDFDTLIKIKTLKYSEFEISSVSWSGTSQYVMAGNSRGEMIVWDLKTDKSEYIYDFGSRILSAKFHPLKEKQGFVCIERQNPVFIEFEGEEVVVKRMKTVEIDIDVDANANANADTLNKVEELNYDSKSKSKGKGMGMGKGKGKSKKDSMLGTGFVYSKDGKEIVMGTTSGVVYVIDTEQREEKGSKKVGNSAIIQVEANRYDSGRQVREVLVRSSDRTVRVCSIEKDSEEVGGDEKVKIQEVTRIQDAIARVNWSSAQFSTGSGELIITGTQQKMEHNIYIWDKYTSQLVKILYGPSELLVNMAIHPVRPIIASISETGKIHVWTRIATQKWSALSGNGFIQIEQNVEYDEPEDEFDVVNEVGDCSGINGRQAKEYNNQGQDKSEDEEIIDVETVEPLYGIDINLPGLAPQTKFFYPPISFDD